jgi:death on curing protein
MVVYLELDEVVAIATHVLGLDVDTALRVTDLGLASSALARPQASFGGEEFYPTLARKAAALLQGLARNHALLDGNKRISLVCTLMFLNLNGYDLVLPSDEESFDVIVGVAAGDVDLDKLTEWIDAHLVALQADD